MSRIHDTNLLFNHGVKKLVAIECNGCHRREKPGSNFADWLTYGCRDVTIGPDFYNEQIFEWDYCDNCKFKLTGERPVGKRTLL